MLSTLERLGNWNPQLFRELKGSFKLPKIALAAGISLFGQILLLMYYFTQLPVLNPLDQTYLNRYCTGNDKSGYSGSASCFVLNGNPVIDWQQWWLDVFIWLSILGIFALVTAGTFMLIGDLEREERRGTLNFIRLSPQSTQNIFLGKLLGVPSLLYLAALLAFPLHLWSGLNAKIPLSLILTLEGLVIAASIFTYSAALLFGLVSSWLGGFQPWLGTATVLFSGLLFSIKPITKDGWDLLNLFSPGTILPYLVPESFIKTQRIFDSDVSNLISSLHDWQWFSLPVGGSLINVAGFTLLNYGLWTALIWQALKRYFRNPNTTAFSKNQSYLLTGYLTILSLGFLVQGQGRERNLHYYPYNLILVGIGIVVVFAGLIAALSPQRQTLQDWARYRQERVKTRVKYSLIWDLIAGEKSPAVVAIALNSLIVAALSVPTIIIFAQRGHRPLILFALLYTFSFILICATLAQMILLMKTSKRSMWAGGTVVAAIILPPMILGVLSIEPGKHGGGLWLLTPFTFHALKYASQNLIFETLLAQFAFFGFLNWQLTRQLKKAGESASKALLKS